MIIVNRDDDVDVESQGQVDHQRTAHLRVALLFLITMKDPLLGIGWTNLVMSSRYDLRNNNDQT
jgi:hypothetical protein